MKGDLFSPEEGLPQSGQEEEIESQVPREKMRGPAVPQKEVRPERRSAMCFV